MHISPAVKCTHVKLLSLYCGAHLVHVESYHKESNISEAPAERSQHANATYHNIVRCNMLRAFGPRVTMCYTRHVATHRKRVGECTQLVVPNNVAICCVSMLRSLGRNLIRIG